MAHFSGDEGLCRIFGDAGGVDPFVLLAAQWLGIPASQVRLRESDTGGVAGCAGVSNCLAGRRSCVLLGIFDDRLASLISCPAYCSALRFLCRHRRRRKQPNLSPSHPPC